MSDPTPCDVAVVGAGLAGLATALALQEQAREHGRETPRVIVLDGEDRVAAHQPGHNSGVIHSGLSYPPGSLKTRLCVEGREAMFAFCAAHGIAHARCGKLVVAVRPDEPPRRGRGERSHDAGDLRRGSDTSRTSSSSRTRSTSSPGTPGRPAASTRRASSAPARCSSRRARSPRRRGGRRRGVGRPRRADVATARRRWRAAQAGDIVPPDRRPMRRPASTRRHWEVGP